MSDDAFLLVRRMRGVLCLERRLEFHLPTSGMSTEVFFNFLWVPYKDQESAQDYTRLNVFRCNFGKMFGGTL